MQAVMQPVTISDDHAIPDDLPMSGPNDRADGWCRLDLGGPK
ncbi:hypothetical protein ES707_06580 [subsurface metagenome]|jgi:hypothetical protein